MKTRNSGDRTRSDMHEKRGIPVSSTPTIGHRSNNKIRSNSKGNYSDCIYRQAVTRPSSNIDWRCMKIRDRTTKKTVVVRLMSRWWWKQLKQIVKVVVTKRWLPVMVVHGQDEEIRVKEQDIDAGPRICLSSRTRKEAFLIFRETIRCRWNSGLRSLKKLVSYWSGTNYKKWFMRKNFCAVRQNNTYRYRRASLHDQLWNEDYGINSRQK